ncbi:MAG: trypsin-like peptidase domain-containing protein [Vicinamibacterales bacterium]
MTGADGTAVVRLAGGSYTVESDSPIALGGKTDEWTVTIDVSAGAETTLNLTADNATVETLADSTDATAGTDPKLLALRWRSAVVGVWTPTARLTGFLAHDSGLIVTNQRGVAAAKTVEVQLSRERKIVGRVVATDEKGDVAVVQVNPRDLTDMRAVPMECDATRQPFKEDTDIVTLAMPLTNAVAVIPGSISKPTPPNIVTDFILDYGGVGGPAFAVDGQFAGVTSSIATDDGRTGGHVSLSTADAACTILVSAVAQRTSPPAVTLLPVEPSKAFPVSALDDAMRTRAGALSAYTMSTSDFDIAFMTPIQVHAGQERAIRLAGGAVRQGVTAGNRLVDPEDNFANWAAYVTGVPPVLLIRATPRLAEGFLTTLARGAALTQGVAIPSIKRPKAGFDRMTLTCGSTTLMPVHALTIEQHISETDVVDEGLYAFDPSALNPQCGTIKLEIFSQKDAGKGETRTVDPKIVEQFWNDFAAYRALP